MQFLVKLFVHQIGHKIKILILKVCCVRRDNEVSTRRCVLITEVIYISTGCH